MTLSELIDEYIAQNAPYLKERTIISYRNKKNELIWRFGDCDITVFTQKFLQEKINLWQEREGATKICCRNRLALLIVALKPYQKFDKFRYIQVLADGKDKKLYDEADIRKIVTYCLSCPTRSYAPIMIAIFTGLRLTEICGLKWEDVDFARKELTVRRNVFTCAKVAYESTPKTRSGARTVAMTDTLCKYLIQYKGQPQEYVASGGATPKPQRSIQRANELLCAKLGVENCGMHAYRHVFASQLLKESTDFKAIADIMGHSNIGITQAVYNHTQQNTRNNIVRKAFDEENSLVPTADVQSELNELKERYAKLRKIVKRMWRWWKEYVPSEQKGE